MAFPLAAATYWLAPLDSTPFTTNLCESSTITPLRFDPAVVQQIIASNPCQPDDPTVHLVFQPGLYETGGCFFRNTYTRETRAAVWWAGTTNPALLGTVGWTDPNPSRRPGRSEALGAYEIATNRLWVVGTGWLTPTGFSRAYRQMVSLNAAVNPPVTVANFMLDLNDPHLTVVPGGWTLITAEEVNAFDWIVGLAHAVSRTRGYVLVPQQTTTE